MPLQLCPAQPAWLCVPDLMRAPKSRESELPAPHPTGAHSVGVSVVLVVCGAALEWVEEQADTWLD